MKSLRAKILVAGALVCVVGLAIYIASLSADESDPADSRNAGGKRSVRSLHGREHNSAGDSGDKAKDDTSGEDADPGTKRNPDLVDHYTSLEKLEDSTAIMSAIMAMTKEPPDPEAIEFLANRLGDEEWIARLREVKMAGPFGAKRKNTNRALYTLIERLAISGGDVGRRALLDYIGRHPYHNNPPEGGREVAIGTLGMNAGVEDDPEAMALLERLATNGESLGMPLAFPAGRVAEDGVPLPEEWVKKVTKRADRISAIMALGTIGGDQGNRILEKVALGTQSTPNDAKAVIGAMEQALSSSNLALLRKIILSTEDENVGIGAANVLGKQSARLIRAQKQDQYGFVMKLTSPNADRYRLRFDGDPEAEALKTLETFRQLLVKARSEKWTLSYDSYVLSAENSLKKIRANAAKKAAGN